MKFLNFLKNKNFSFEKIKNFKILCELQIGLFEQNELKFCITIFFEKNF
jgi:hypothetical protein